MKQSFTNILLFLTLILLEGCDNEKAESVISDDEVITFKIGTTSMQEHSTYSLTESDEYAISTVDVLVFDAAGLFRYHRQGFDWQYTNFPTSTDGTFKVGLPIGQLNTYMVLLNCRSEISSASLVEGIDNIASVSSKIEASSADEWSAKLNGSTSFRHIPMYGRISGQNVSSTDKTIPNAGSTTKLYMIRMLARLDVTLNSSILPSNFVLDRAYLFNRKNKGLVAYDDLKWDAVNGIVTGVNIPTVTTTKLPSTALLNAGGYKATANKIQHSIYTFEAASVTDKENATALVVGGWFNNSTDLHYYRLDIPILLAGTPQADTYGDILRNHLYKLEIKKIVNEGALTPEVAFDGKFELEAEVTAWDLANVGTDIDGQYNLSVSINPVKFSSAGGTIVVTTTTDHPKVGVGLGIKSDWISVSGGTWTDKARQLSVTVASNSGGTREGYFTLKVKNLEVRVKVIQD